MGAEAGRYSDVAGTQQIGRSSYGYDALGRVTAIDHFDALDAALAEYDYAHDLAGQIVQWFHHGETIDFTHDDAGQLTGADYATQADESYSYDANGNRTGGGMTIGDNNQVLSDGTYNYAYDDEGNLVLKTTIATGDYVEYAYDHRNRMVSATNYSSGSVVLQVVEFAYDLFDRRIAKTVDDDGAGPNDAVTVDTVYDGEHAWADFDESEDVLARYLFGDRIDELIARWQPVDGTAWYLTDHLGTVQDLVDDAGDLLNTITYDSFGNIVVQTNAAAGDRFTFTGREFDSELDLYYYRARFYDPRLGRFVSQDPIGFAGGDANLYRYVENNPLGATDPSGLKPGGLLDWIQGGLDLAGMAPGVGIVPDALNTLISLGRGDVQQAGINAFAMIPVVGDAAKGAQLTAKAVKAVDKANDARKAADRVSDARRAADAVSSAPEKIPTINGRKPVNSKYAGETHPSGVRFKENGFPDFTPHSKAQVEMDGLTGNYAKDAALANKAAGLKKTPDGYVWHHVEDGRTLQLIPKDIHNAVNHTGGAAVIRNGGRFD